MKSLRKQQEAYEAMQDELEAEHFREWVVFYDEELVGFYPSSSAAVEDAIRRFGRGPYLIRQIAPPPTFVPMFARVEPRRVGDLIESSSYVHVEREAPPAANTQG